MSTAKSVLGIPLLALLILLIIMVVGFIVPVDAQPHSCDGIAPTVASPTGTPELTPTSTPVSPANTLGSATTLRSYSSSATEVWTPVVPLAGAGQLAGLLLPAILVLAAVLSCIYVAVTWSVQRAS